MLPKKPFSAKIGLLLIVLCFHSAAQAGELQATDSINYSNRKAWVVGGNAVAYTASMTGLYQLWYKDHSLTSFHFFNDNAEWMQMDKVGHAFSSYYEGVVGIKMLKWAGFDHRTSSIFGGAYGFLLQTGIEVFDGFSEGWGASTGDLLANGLGSALVIGQSIAWDEQRVWMKFSYAPTSYAQVRPNLLGATQPERLFKDYNGQTYWLSVNVHSFVPESKWPAWLNIAVGYGIDGFVGGDDNIFTDAQGAVLDYTQTYPRLRQWYLSPDIDLSKIKTKRPAVRIALTVLNSIKVPLPSLEYNRIDGFVGHPVKF